MIELSRIQDEEVGDGTTSVIVLAGEMLHVAEAFIDKHYHPTVICRTYNKALEDALAVPDKIAMHVDVNDRGAMLGLVKSSIGTQFTINPHIILLDCPVECKKGENQTNAELMKEEDCAVRRLRKTDNNRIAKACGAVIVNRPEELQESDVGTGAVLFEDAMFAARNILKNPQLLPGGGATELTVSATLTQKSSSVEGVEKPYEAAALAFEAEFYLFCPTPFKTELFE
ncbi:hypothetical protein ABZP36_010716 [Zizania latifolia]